MQTTEIRIVFSCPSCSWRRKTYIENEYLQIRCRHCNHIFKVSEGLNVVYKTAHDIPERSKPDFETNEGQHSHLKSRIQQFILVVIHILLYWFVVRPYLNQ